MIESERHDAVAEDDGLLLPAMPVDRVDHRRDLALGHQAIDDVERDLHASRKHASKDHAPGRGVIPLLEGLTLLVDTFPAVFDLGVQADHLLMQRMIDIGHIAEHLPLARPSHAAHDRYRPYRRTPSPRPVRPPAATRDSRGP